MIFRKWREVYKNRVVIKLFHNILNLRNKQTFRSIYKQIQFQRTLPFTAAVQ